MDILINYIAGVAGGVAVVLIGHPFDTTKTRLQTSPPGFYAGSWDCVKKTLKWEGFGGFYSGIWSPLAGQMFFRAVSFATFHHTVKLVCDYDLGLHRFHPYFSSPVHPNSSQLMLAGSITGLGIAVVEAPIDLIKTKLQIQIFSNKLQNNYIPLYTTVNGCIRHTIHHNGVRALWQGVGATAIRNVPANGVFFPVNEMSKRAFANANGTSVDKLDFHQRLVCGALAGLHYWVLTFPLDAVKARMMAVSYDQRRGWMDTARMMAREGGYRAFLRGLGPCAMRAAPACSVMFATVDIVRGELTMCKDRFQDTRSPWSLATLRHSTSDCGGTDNRVTNVQVLGSKTVTG